AIEVAVVEAVTQSVLPGVVGRDDLGGHRPECLAWWRAHARPADGDQEAAAATADEERHHEDAGRLLDRAGAALGHGTATRAVEDTLDLLFATVRCHDVDAATFDGTRFAIPRS